ncbi:hypothetical protein [Paraburkholderia piptadeniae]|uniref:hypothetical protein n=1 Tax=Paraburkholderia piptadeniae TaxID=1701573 RepID=UPI000B3F7524|nr:hypothetical protein [Paraburkholderia piptadeniae]
MEITLGALMGRDQFIKWCRLELTIVEFKQSRRSLNCMRSEPVTRFDVSRGCQFAEARVSVGVYRQIPVAEASVKQIERREHRSNDTP